MESVLEISGVNFPPSSIRGATQTLEPIDSASKTKRTVNGTLVDLANPIFRKYRSKISCKDQVPPALNNVWPGTQVTVKCISELCYKTQGGSAAKSVVSGSSRTDGDYTFYRPQLTMRIISFNYDTDEYGASVNWSMDLEEI